MAAEPNMLSLAQAQQTVVAHVHPLPTETVPLDQAAGRVLAANVVCDMDYPPFDKAMMDGYAVRCPDFADGFAELQVASEVAAGDAPGPRLEAGRAVPISTGAPVPAGADAVVPVEHSTLSDDGERVELRYDPSPGRHIAPRAQDVTAGSAVLAASTRLGPAQMAAAAAAGATVVSVYRRPAVSVLATGSELVPPDAKPTGGQIRNSNSSYLLAAIRRLGLQPESLGIVSDNRGPLRDALQRGLHADVLLTVGGISMGRHDLVPDLLAELGVSFRFRKVAMKPGKPTLFGTHDRTKLVFALPGNPVSCFVGLWFLAAPALAGLQGALVRFPAGVQAKTDRPLPATSARQTFLPARTSIHANGELSVTPVPWHGSGDLFGLALADALIARAAGAPQVPAGQTVRVVPLEHPWPLRP